MEVDYTTQNARIIKIHQNRTFDAEYSPGIGISMGFKDDILAPLEDKIGTEINVIKIQEGELVRLVGARTSNGEVINDCIGDLPFNLRSGATAYLYSLSNK